jgi:hypothetical protein
MKFFFIDIIKHLKSYLNEGLISLFFHGLKSIVVLFINWIVLNKLNSSDYIVWSITSSVLMIATVSDLGIGQHSVTLLIHAKEDSRKSILINACIAITPLFFLAFVFVYLSLTGAGYYVFLMALFVSLRLFSIPFGALLNATNNFKTRKIIEFLVYLFAAVVISLIIVYKKDVYMSLLVLNISFFIGSICTILVTLKDIPNNDFLIDVSIFKSTLRVLHGSLPFLVNNLTSLLTYGGFIWFSSFVLPGNLIAKLSVLHSFLFMTLYQVYDVFLRSKQADFILPERINFFLKLNRFFILGTSSFILIAGFFVLKIIAPNLYYNIFELLFFSLFMIVEFCYLIIQSIVQVDYIHSKGLFFYSIIRLISIIIAFVTFYFFSHSSSLAVFLLLLSLFSFIGLFFSNYYFKSKSSFSL